MIEMRTFESAFLFSILPFIDRTFFQLDSSVIIPYILSMKKNILPAIAILALPFLVAMGEQGIGIIFWGLVFRHLYGEYFQHFFPNNQKEIRE